MLYKKKLTQFLDKDEGENGSATVEFALAGSLVIVTVIVIIEIMAVLLLNILIEGGVREAARFGITGNLGQSGREQAILDIIEQNTLGLIDINNATITTLVYNSFSDIGQSEDYIDNSPANGQYDDGEAFTDSNSNGIWDIDKGTPGLGEDNDIVLYIIEYDWPFMTGLISSATGNPLRLKASIPVKNEPYTIQNEAP